MGSIRQIKFNQFVTLQRGFDLPKSQRADGPYPVVASTSVDGFHSDYKVLPPGVTTGRSGALGKVLYIKEPFWPLNTTLWVKDFKGNFPRYVYYFLQTLGLERYNAGAGVPTLNRNHLDNLEVLAHRPPDQHKIAAILSAYDDLIENNTRRIKILEEMAQAIYREWFVHFRFPGHDRVKMVPSRLGQIPNGWKVAKLGEVVELLYGKALKQGDRMEGNVPVYGSSGVVGYHDTPMVNGPGIIVGRKGNVGTVHWSDVSFFPIDTVFYVRTSLPLYYVYYNLRTQNFISGDAAVPGLNRNQAYSLLMLVPAPDVLNQFSELTGNFFASIRNLQLRNANLRQTRDLLLPKLISGELDIKMGENLP
jgi:type I restriction enzyme S subunit